MKIVGDGIHHKRAEGNLFYCKIKKLPVVRLKFNSSVLAQNDIITAKKFLRGKAPFGISLLRPGVREIQIDDIYFSGSKVFRDQLCFAANKAEIRQLQLILPVHTPQKYTGIFLNPNVIDFRMKLGKLQNKSSLSGSNLKIDGIVVSEHFFPGSFVFFRVLNYKRAGRDGISCPRNIAKSQCVSPCMK